MTSESSHASQAPGDTERRKTEWETAIEAQRRIIDRKIAEAQRRRAAGEGDEGVYISGSFVVPAQTEALDFKALLERPLLGSYYLYGSDDFKKLARDSSPLVTGMQGGEYVEADLRSSEKDEFIIKELGVEPIPLEEWKYLFSQMPAERLSGETTFYVRFDDEVVRAIRTTIIPDGGGPYSYSATVDVVTPETVVLKSYVDPKIIFLKSPGRSV